MYIGKQPAVTALTASDITDGIISTDKLGSNAVTSAKMFSGFANGITMFDQWRTTASPAGDQSPISSNLEQVDTDGFATEGTAMTVSSGIFTFPTTGKYLLQLQVNVYEASSSGHYFESAIQTTTDNSTYSVASRVYGSLSDRGSSSSQGSTFNAFIFDVTNTTNCKVSFHIDMIDDAGNQASGDTGLTTTGMFFTRIGDT
jgi:hypothetical protein